MTSRSICTARWKRSRAITRRAWILANCASSAAQRKQNLAARSRSRHRRRSGFVVAALSRSCHSIRIRLDARACAGTTARHRIAAGDFGSRRLGRINGDHRRDRRREVWVTHGAEEALVHWCTMRQLRARPLHIVGYGDEEGGADEADTKGAASA